jgi:hypothetical protein
MLGWLVCPRRGAGLETGLVRLLEAVVGWKLCSVGGWDVLEIGLEAELEALLVW